MGTDEEPGRCASVETEGWRRRRHRAGCPRPVEASRAFHADHGPLPAVRPCLRKDFAALHGEPGSVRRRVRPGVVQADAPRHGPARTLSRPGGSCRRAHLAGPHPRGQSQVDRCAGHRLPQGQDPGFRSVRLATGFDRLGVGVHVPWLRQARRCERRPHSPGAAEGLGSQPACPTGEGAEDSGGHPECVQQRASPAARRSRWPT